MKYGSIIRLKNVNKKFIIPHEEKKTLKETIISLPKKRRCDVFYALKNVSFRVAEGEFFGIIGKNGSGKSTLLKIIAGIYKPDSGLVEVDGFISPFLELGVGFNGELSGRDNIFLYGAVLGLDEKRIQEKFDEIVEFAEIRRFIDQKLKNYSSGMQARLAFSVAIQSDAPIMLVDEVLAVGDSNFQKKCEGVFMESKQNKRTIVFVSHDLAVMEKWCDRCMLLDKSQVKMIGEPREVINKYNEILESDENNPLCERGNGEASLVGVSVHGLNGKEISEVGNEKEFLVRADFMFNENIRDPVFGILIRDRKGRLVIQENTLWVGIKVTGFSRGETAKVIFRIKNSFEKGNLYITLAAAKSEGKEFLVWKDNVVRVEINKRNVSPQKGIVIKML